MLLHKYCNDDGRLNCEDDLVPDTARRLIEAKNGDRFEDIARGIGLPHPENFGGKKE